MGKPLSFTSFLELSLFRRNACPSCQIHRRQLRQFSSQIPRPKQPSQNQAGSKTPQESSSSDDEHQPFQLKHPLGLAHPPKEGENTGVDRRTLRQRGADLGNQEKRLQRRSQLAKEFSKPYFRDWLNTRYHHGKTFISNPRLFKGDKALYFPNMYGRTLRKSNPLQDTTPVLRGKISVVSLFSTLWAEQQTASFVDEKKNPALHELIKSSDSVAQRVELNVEQNWLKAWMVRLFMSNLRKKYPDEQHERYFLVTKGVSNMLKQQIGMMNGMVGYVYLLDDSCKIRWAGSSLAQPDELTALNNGVRKLVGQKKLDINSAPSRHSGEKSDPEQEENQQKPRVVRM